MRTLKQHLNSVMHAMSTRQSVDKKNEIINATNISANSIAGMFPIGQLMKKITVGPESRLPSNMAGISVVRDTSDGSRMWERGEGSVGSDEEVGRYYLDIEYEPFSKLGLPFKSTGSISEGESVLTCDDMVSLAEGAYLYKHQVGETVYNTRLDAGGNPVVDAEGKLVIYPVPSTLFNPQLPGVRFYDSGLTNNGQIVFYGENEELAYWNSATLGWIITEIADVGEVTPDGYFVITDGNGEGLGDWKWLFLTFGSIEESSVETISDDDFSDYVVCITNPTYGDFYYNITSVNYDATFNISRTHPFDETDSVVTIYREATSRIRFVDYSEQEITSGTYDVFYWTYPNPLTQDDDVIPFAYPDYLELLTIRRLPETKDRRPVSKREMEDAKAAAKKKEPKQFVHPRPTTAQGSPFRMGSAETDTYTVRGG